MNNYTMNFQFRIDRKTYNKLEKMSKKSGRSKANILRGLIDGNPVREMPPLEYHDMTGLLHNISNNMNQVARVANATGHIDTSAFIAAANEVSQKIYELKKAVWER